MGMADFEIFVDVLKICCRSGRPAETHLRSEHLLQAGVHLLLLNQLAPIRLSDTITHGGTKAGILLKQAQRRILDQPFGVHARGSCNLSKPGFLLWSEMDFHRLQITPNGYWRQFRLQ